MRKKSQKTGKTTHPLKPLELCGRPLGVKGSVLREGLHEQAVVFRESGFVAEEAKARKR